MYRRFTRILLLTLILAPILWLQGCSDVVDDPTNNWTAKEFYEDSQSALDIADFEAAIKSLETLEARFPFDRYAKQAQIDIAYSYYKFDEPESALSAIERFMRLHPRDPHLDYAYYLKGLINFNRGGGLLDGWVEHDPAQHDAEILHNAFNDFSSLVHRFPDSHYAGDAHQRLIYLRNKLAQKQINVAEYYLKRGTWLAAANRAKAVIEQYQKSIWSQRALEIMVTSYQNLGFTELAADAERVLALNVGDKKPEQMEARLQ